jgi:hypothetical protein
MSMKDQRKAIDGDEPRRDRAWAQLLADEPSDPLLKLAYWTHVADQTRDRVFEAARNLRLAGATWPVVAMAHGERSAQGTARKFSAYIEQTSDSDDGMPSSDPDHSSGP